MVAGLIAPGVQTLAAPATSFEELQGTRPTAIKCPKPCPSTFSRPSIVCGLRSPKSPHTGYYRRKQDRSEPAKAISTCPSVLTSTQKPTEGSLVSFPSSVSELFVLEKSLYGQEFVLDRDYPEGADREATADDIVSLVQRERSLLESQWELPSQDPTLSAEIDEAALDSLKASCSTKNIVVTKSTSARKRRMQARVKRDLADQAADANVFRVGLENKGKSDVSEKESSSDFLATFLTEIGKAKLLTKEEEIELAKRVRKSVELQAIRARLSEDLGREATHNEWAKSHGCSVYSLRRKLREGELARHKLIATNLRLVVSVAKKYLRHGVELSDLVAAGTMGLSKGVEKFDPTRGYKLSTYVHWWIRQAVTRAVADHSRTIRLPVHVHETLGRLRRAKAQLISDGEQPNVKNLANTLGLSERKVDNVLKLKYKTKSMNEELSGRMEEGSTMDNFIADPDAESRPWKELEVQFLQANVKRLLLDQLDPRERDIIRLRFGFGRMDGRTMTLDVISQRYGVSRERIRQLETVAVRKLKVLSQNKELQRYCY